MSTDQLPTAPPFNPDVDVFDPERAGFELMRNVLPYYEGGGFQAVVEPHKCCSVWRIGDDDFIVNDEIADCIFLLIGLAGKRGIDVAAAMREKFKVNRARTWQTGLNDRGYYSHIDTKGGDAT